MKTKTCQDAFDQGATDRETNPLNAGIYKIRESLRHIKQIYREISKIKSVIQGKLSPCRLTHCTAADMDRWLQNVPATMSYRLSYEIIPAFKALSNEGLPEELCENIANSLNLISKLVISNLESARQFYANDILVEYQIMDCGESHAGDTVETIIILMNTALN